MTGSGAANEDRVFTVPNGVVVLDGASQPEATDRDGAWIADRLGTAIASRLLAVETGRDLAAIVASAIEETAKEYALVPGESPSTTVAIARWQGQQVEAFVLGDSPVIGLTKDGSILQLRDDRLSGIATSERRAMRRAGGFGFEHRDLWCRLVAAQRKMRNQPGGYWIGEATPEAAMHARRKTWQVGNLAGIMVVTDGMSAGVDKYQCPPDWYSAFRIARKNPECIIRLVHDTEAADATGSRFPRSKLHDDKTLALIEFNS